MFKEAGSSRSIPPRAPIVPHGRTQNWWHGEQVAATTKGLSITGDIAVNGQPVSRSFFLENAAYVPQEDRLWSALTGMNSRLSLSSSCQLLKRVERISSYLPTPLPLINYLAR